MTKPTLLSKTKELLANDKRTTYDISTSSGIPFYWLQKFPSSENPSVNRVEQLYNFLSDKPLQF